MRRSEKFKSNFNFPQKRKLIKITFNQISLKLLEINSTAPPPRMKIITIFFYIYLKKKMSTPPIVTILYSANYISHTIITLPFVPNYL